MKVLIIGGAGYIGSITAQHVLRAGHDVIVLDNLSCGHQEAVPEGASFICEDMGNIDEMDIIFSKYKIDAVMHFAALSLVGESVQKPALYFANNLINGLRLLDSMLKHNVKQLVFSSTAAVYGEPSEYPILENFALNPTNPYGESKLAFEKALHWYAQAYGLRYTSLRYFNAAGASDTLGENHEPEETHLIPLVLQVAGGKRSYVTIFGEDYKTPDGTAIRDYIHVKDLASAHLAAVEYLLDDGQSNIFNLGSGTGHSVKQVIEGARKITSHSIPVRIGPRRLGDPSVLISSNEKIQRFLGWKPKYAEIETIIADAWTWYQKYPSGYKLDTANV